jgi:hypothetical protein
MGDLIMNKIKKYLGIMAIALAPSLFAQEANVDLKPATNDSGNVVETLAPKEGENKPAKTSWFKGLNKSRLYNDNMAMPGYDILEASVGNMQKVSCFPGRWILGNGKVRLGLNVGNIYVGYKNRPMSSSPDYLGQLYIDDKTQDPVSPSQSDIGQVINYNLELERSKYILPVTVGARFLNFEVDAGVAHSNYREQIASEKDDEDAVLKSDWSLALGGKYNFPRVDIKKAKLTPSVSYLHADGSNFVGAGLETRLGDSEKGRTTSIGVEYLKNLTKNYNGVAATVRMGLLK